MTPYRSHGQNYGRTFEVTQDKYKEQKTNKKQPCFNHPSPFPRKINQRKGTLLGRDQNSHGQHEEKESQPEGFSASSLLLQTNELKTYFTTPNSSQKQNTALR